MLDVIHECLEVMAADDHPYHYLYDVAFRLCDPVYGMFTITKGKAYNALIRETNRKKGINTERTTKYPALLRKLTHLQWAYKVTLPAKSHNARLNIALY